MGRRQWLSLLIQLPVMTLLALPLAAQVRSVCPGGLAPQGVVVAVGGDVRAQSQTGSSFDLAVGTPLCPLDQITTGSRSRVEFRLAGKDTTTGTSDNAVTVIPAPESDCVTLLNGLLALISSVRGRHCVRTPFIDAGIEGTEAVVAVDGPTGDSFVLVRAGEVGVVDRRDPDDRRLLEAGPAGNRNAAFATRTQHLTIATPENVPAKFRDLLLQPEGATDWAVYYPPILLGTGVADPSVREAAALLRSGDPARAERVLAAATLEGRDEAASLALRSVAAVSLDDAPRGLVLADEAVALDPGLGAAHIAQSYALQAQGKLDAARLAAKAAVKAAPDDAYAWARLAELELTIGDRRAAGEAVSRSLGVAETALARSIEGFVALAANDFDKAEAAFHRAIAIDSQAPLPRLGLGLAAIRQGRLAEGRLEMEAAVALDPRRADLRTWLARAYLEEQRPAKAAAQLDLALDIDPDDPNIHLFSALERFEANDPIGALRDLEAAAGDRRAALRSASGLAEDEAVRSIAAGRVLDVLGFDVLAMQKAARAVDLFPTSPAAHRFLFDAFRGRPGFEIVQTSELLRYQLLAPPSNDPVQPSLSEPSLALVTVPGVTRPTFHEFSPLFNRDGWFGVGFGALGNNGVLSDEVAVSYLNRNFSVSAGQYYFQDDGFRVNDEVEHSVLSVLAKYAPTPEVTFTAEARGRQTTQGDRFLRPVEDPFIRVEEGFDPNLFRLGVHVKATRELDLLAFGTVSQVESKQGFSYVDPSLGGEMARFSDEIFAAEVQGVYQFGMGHVTAGGSVSRTRGEVSRDSGTKEDAEADQASLYAYTVLAPASNLELTLGLSYDWATATKRDLGTGDVLADDVSQLNPKLGVRAEIVGGLVLRGAAFRTSKRNFVSDQTLEPTTIAGFAQFFDDFDRTDAWTVATGADVRVADNVWLGAEYLHRSFTIPLGTTADDGEEQAIVGYANATVGTNWALSAGVQFSNNSTEKFDRPSAVKTLLLSGGARYFHPSGFFAAAEAVWADQSAEELNGRPDTEANATGFVLNGAVGYRLPANRGLLSLEVENLLDNDLSLQNPLVNSARPSTRPLAEELSIVARMTVSF
jgi:tetratricopeptide (TPR) repeat protein